MAAVAVLAVVGAVACSSDDDATPRPSVSGASTAAPTTASTTTTEASIAPVPSPGCRNRGEAPAVTDQRREIDVDGTTRWYLLTTPGPAATSSSTSSSTSTSTSGAAEPDPLPLLLDFHGLAEGAEVHTRMSGFDEIAARERFVVAYPNGTGTPVHWAVETEDNPDLDFTDHLIDALGSELCLDMSRVYSTGLSNGAIFSSLLGCVRAERIAAIAPVAGVQYPDGCQTDRPVPVLAVHGTADPILQFNGGVGGFLAGEDPPEESSGGGPDGSASSSSIAGVDIDGPGYPEAVRKWAAHNGCRPKPADTEPVPDVTLRTYDCPPGGEVEFYVMHGGGHSWPGSAFSETIEMVVGPTNMALPASQLIWDFLSAQRLPAL